MVTKLIEVYFDEEAQSTIFISIVILRLNTEGMATVMESWFEPLSDKHAYLKSLSQFHAYYFMQRTIYKIH